MRSRPAASFAIFSIATLLAALCGCASVEPLPPTPAEQAQQIEPLLAAAGFRILPADNPERHKQLQSMAPLQLQYYVGKKGNLHYFMADPYYCNCMYIGSEKDYQNYQQIRLNQQFQTTQGEITQQQLEAQQLEEMDMQEEMFNPYGLGLVGPMGPAIYW